MNRLLALALVVAAAGLILFTASGAGSGAAPLQAASPKPIVDEPRGFIATDLLPLKVPGPLERKQDESTRPYHLLVRVVDFEALEPLDVESSRLVIPGAQEIRKVDVGTFLIEGVTLGLLSVGLLEEDPPTPVLGPGQRETYLAMRNPVVLARHAITTCDLIVLTEEQALTEIPARGFVSDRFTGDVMPGVNVVRQDGSYVITDDDGRFEFDEPITVAGLFGLAFLVDGYIPLGLSSLSLSRPWVERLHETGDAMITLRPESPDR